MTIQAALQIAHSAPAKVVEQKPCGCLVQGCTVTVLCETCARRDAAIQRERFANPNWSMD